MIRRSLIVFVAVLALLGGATFAVAAKRKTQPGPYPGATSNGIPMTITLAGSRTSGTFTYCDAVAVPFTVTGRSFTVTVPNPDGTPYIQASGTFTLKPKKKKGKGTVTGTMPLGGGCDGTVQTFSIKHA